MESNKETEKKEKEVSTKEPDQQETSKKSSQEVKEEQIVNKPSSGEVKMRTNDAYVKSFISLSYNLSYYFGMSNERMIIIIITIKT